MLEVEITICKTVKLKVMFENGSLDESVIQCAVFL